MSRFKIDAVTRQLMLKNLAKSDLGIDKLLTKKGERDYPELLRTSFASHDEEWLAEQLAAKKRIKKGSFKTETDLKAKALALAVEVYETFLMVATFERMLEEGTIPLWSVKPGDVPRFDPKIEDDSNRFLATLNLLEPYSKWVSYWCEGLLACQRMGGDARPLSIKRPADEQQVANVESQLGQRLPPSLRQTFLHFSAGFEFHWFLPDDAVPPFSGIFSGGFEEIALAWLVKLEENRQNWVENVFSDPEDLYDSVWYNKLAVISVSNGDMIAIDLESADGFVTYLSHEGDERLHGKVLGVNFADFMERWSRLGCVGPEDWQLEPFIEDTSTGINLLGVNASKWREWFGLK